MVPAAKRHGSVPKDRRTVGKEAGFAGRKETSFAGRKKTGSAGRRRLIKKKRPALPVAAGYKENRVLPILPKSE